VTIWATIGSLAAVGGFGSLAAISDHGTTPSDPVTAAVTTTDAGSAVSSRSIAVSATPAPAATAAPTVSSTTGSAHASTGGS